MAWPSNRGLPCDGRHDATLPIRAVVWRVAQDPERVELRSQNPSREVVTLLAMGCRARLFAEPVSATRTKPWRDEVYLLIEATSRCSRCSTLGGVEVGLSIVFVRHGHGAEHGEQSCRAPQSQRSVGSTCGCPERHPRAASVVTRK